MVKVPRHSWAYSTLPEETWGVYAAVIAELDDTLVHRRKPVLIIVPLSNPPAVGEASTTGTDPEDDPTPSSTSRKATCSCPHITRVTKKVRESTTIRCDSCGQPFCLA